MTPMKSSLAIVIVILIGIIIEKSVPQTYVANVNLIIGICVGLLIRNL